MSSLYKIEFYVPASHLEIVKNALFGAGAGRVGPYEHCAWQTEGRGQYRPLQGSSPFRGEAGKVETVEEYKVELVCEEEFIAVARKALLESHPYESAAYSILKIESI
jgi:hypothetical protein